MAATRVLLDIAPAVHQNAGLARYTGQLAAHLAAEQADKVDLRYFYNTHSGHTPPAWLPTRPTVTLPASQLRWRLNVLAGQVTKRPFAAIARQLRPGEVYHAAEHLLPRLPTPTVLTVHDLIFERYPEHHTARNRQFLRVGMPLFVRAADAIIAVSQHTRRDLVELYGADPGKIHVVYEGIDSRFAPAGAEAVAAVRARYSPDLPYLLMVGTLEPRKNHRAALRALARLQALGHNCRLIIAGGGGWLFEPIRHEVDLLGYDDSVVFTGHVPDDELVALYSGAACVLAPSLYEGFGFTVLEAMACGAPVVCSNVSSLPEVAGDAALLVAPQDDEALALAAALVLTQPHLAAALRERGVAQAGRFRWSQCAAETDAVYAWAADRARQKQAH